MSVLPFEYLTPERVQEVCGFRSRNNLQRKVRDKQFPEPDYLNGRARWRSDRVAQWLTERAAEADAAREERAKAARQKGQRMLAARGKVAA